MIKQSAPQELDAACAHALMETLPRLKGLLHRIFQQGALGDELSPAQFFFMCAVSRWGHPSPTELARKFRVTMPAITGLAEGLVSRGLLERQADPADRRQIRLVVTSTGQELCQRFMETVEREIGAQIARLDLAKKRRLPEALNDLAAALGEGPTASE